VPRVHSPAPNGGRRIVQVGFGTLLVPEGNAAGVAKGAAEIGDRHVDTATHRGGKSGGASDRCVRLVWWSSGVCRALLSGVDVDLWPAG
jgi:diketogulonate reductase-like aldo/keto reductase